MQEKPFSLHQQLKAISITELGQAITVMRNNAKQVDPIHKKKAEVALFLVELLEPAKRGMIHMQNAAAKYNFLDLEAGVHYLAGNIDSKTMNLARLLYDRLVQEKREASAAKKDAQQETVQTAASTKEISALQEKLLVDEVGAKGKVIVSAPMSHELSKARRVSTGFQTVSSPDFPTWSMQGGIGREVQNSFGIGNILYLLEEKNIPAAVTLEPLTTSKPIYEAPPAPKGFFKKMFAGIPEPKLVGTQTEAMPISTFTRNPQDKEQAWRINLIVTGTRERPYRDPTTNREGCSFYGGLVLPKSLAERAFHQIQSNPKLVFTMFAQVDPELMKSQEGFMPGINQIVIVPPENQRSAYIFNANKHATGFRPEHIKSMN